MNILSRKNSPVSVLSFVLFCFFQTAVWAQDTDVNSIDRLVLLTIAPLALVDIYDGASYRLGGEISAGRKLAFALEAGGYLNYLKATKINPKGYIIKPEIKYYIRHHKKSDRKFISLEYGFKDQEYGFRHKLFVEENPMERKYQMFRKIHTATFKYGISRNIGKRFNLQYYGGIGLRFLHSRRALSETDRQIISEGTDDCSMQENLIKVEGRKLLPNFQLGLQVGLGI